MTADNLEQDELCHNLLLLCAEALSEALCLFQSPSRLSQADSAVKHCLIFSLTEAHNMAVDWPYPLASASSDKVKPAPAAYR